MRGLSSGWMLRSPLIDTLSRLTARSILCFIIYLVEYCGSSMLKKQVSALGRAWSGFCLLSMGFIMKRTPFRSNYSLLRGRRSWPQQNLMTFSLYYYEISFIISQKYFITGLYSFNPPAYLVCFFRSSTSTLGTPQIIVLSSSPEIWFKKGYEIIWANPSLIFCTCRLISSILRFSIISTYLILSS